MSEKETAGSSSYEQEIILQFTTQSSRISIGNKICTWQWYIMMNELQLDK